MKKGCLSLTAALALGSLALMALVMVREWNLTPEQRAAEAQREAVEEQQVLARRTAEAQMQREQNQRVQMSRESFLEELVKIEGVEYGSINAAGDVMTVRLAPLMHVGTDHVRVMCEGIAYKWAAAAGLKFVRCESWYGNKLYAVGEYDGPIPAEFAVQAFTAGLEQQQAKDTAALLAMEGKTLPEVEGTHGPALSKDKDTGWATWPKFKAQFQAGKVVEVELP
jgi:hypothetical protein